MNQAMALKYLKILMPFSFIQQVNADSRVETEFHENLLFTVTEEDFQQMDGYVQYAEELRRLMSDYFHSVRPSIQQIGRPWGSPKRQEAQEIFYHLEESTAHIENAARGYQVMCKDMKDLCCDIDNLTEWYIEAVDELLCLLDKIILLNFKYCKVADLPQRYDIDISPIDTFFQKWTSIIEQIVARAKTIDAKCTCCYDDFVNQIPRDVDYIPAHIGELTDIIKNDTFVQFVAAIRQEGNAIRDMMGLSEITSSRLPKPALYNMNIYLSHIITYYNAIFTNVKSMKETLLQAEDAQRVMTVYNALKLSKEAWLATEKASQTYVEVSSKYIHL